MEILDFLSVSRTAFTVLGYPLSYVELLGTVFNLASVWLAARNRVATWPVGLVGVLLFLALFYQIRLYSDAFEQVFYLAASVYGWRQWARVSGPNARPALPIRISSARSILLAALATVVLSLLAGRLTSRLHLLAPALFPEAASYPYPDAATTVMSFAATLLMARRRLECWAYWILVDIAGVWLYAAKEVRFVALLYAIFLVLATGGLLRWIREAKEMENHAPTAR